MTNILISPRLMVKIVSQTIPPTSMKKQGFLDCKTGDFLLLKLSNATQINPDMIKKGRLVCRMQFRFKINVRV